MVRIIDIISEIEAIAPPMYQETYDNSRLICGNPLQMINSVLLTLDCIEVVVDEAIAKGCGLIVAHHPIVFKGIKSLTGKNYVERTLIKAIKNDIAIYACHTNLDNMRHGVNAVIASKLSLENTKVLSPKSHLLKQLYTYVPQPHLELVRNALFEAGAGHIGDYSSCSYVTKGTGTFKPESGARPHIGNVHERFEGDEMKLEVVYAVDKEKAILKALRSAHPYEEIAYGCVQIEVEHAGIGAGLIGTLPMPLDEAIFLKSLKINMNTPVIRHTALSGKPISTVAVCGGAGSFLLPDAIRAGADVYISADFKYHEFFDAEGRILIADIGHYESEQFTYEIFSELLSKKFSTFAVLKTSVVTNPVKYYS
jgi:dinuclear metal center YbgI/SA1388 family protein